jgi:hypothetical protein
MRAAAADAVEKSETSDTTEKSEEGRSVVGSAGAGGSRDWLKVREGERLVRDARVSAAKALIGGSAPSAQV